MIKPMIAVFCALVLCTATRSQTICEGRKVVPIVSFNQCSNNPWILVFEDNFDGQTLDSSKWNAVTGVPRDPYFNDQKAWHTPRNIVVENGLLKIITQKEHVHQGCFDIWINNSNQNLCSDFDYTTAEIWSKYEFGFGKFEARIKIPKGKGLWPAFWLFSGNPWKELDIFEFRNENNIWGHYSASALASVLHTASHLDHDKNGTDNQCTESQNVGNCASDFHIFALTWEKDKIQWYLDGELLRTDYRYYTIQGQVTGCNIKAWTPYIQNEIYPADPMAIILNVAVQSGTDKAPDATTPLPAQMQVDWVRYYKRGSCEDIVINNASQLPVGSNQFNTVIGNHIQLNCAYTLKAGQQLDVIAKSSIETGVNFKVDSGALFHTSIVPTLCDIAPNEQAITDNNFLHISDSGRYTMPAIQVYPNPNKGIFEIRADMSCIEGLTAIVAAIDGNVVYSQQNIENTTLLVNLPNLLPGMYIVYLINTFTNEARTQKFIVK